MNVREGMRRLALLLGVLGAAFGCFASYVVLRDALEARARHKAFERLATSDVVQQERNAAKAGWEPVEQSPKAGLPLPPGAVLVVENPTGTVESSTVHRGGIKTIHWTKDFRVESIETEDGATLYPTPAPTFWPYLLAAIFPVLGFAIPWASVRALAWVGVGFFENSE